MPPSVLPFTRRMPPFLLSFLLNRYFNSMANANDLLEDVFGRRGVTDSKSSSRALCRRKNGKQDHIPVRRSLRVLERRRRLVGVLLSLSVCVVCVVCSQPLYTVWVNE